MGLENLFAPETRMQHNKAVGNLRQQEADLAAQRQAKFVNAVAPIITNLHSKSEIKGSTPIDSDRTLNQFSSSDVVGFSGQKYIDNLPKNLVGTSESSQKLQQVVNQKNTLIPKTAIAAKSAMTEDQILQQEAEMNKRREALKMQDLEKRIAESSNFNDAFRTARQAGLSTFKWKGGLYGTQLATEVKPATEAKPAAAESSDTTSSFTKLVDDAKAETAAQAAKAASARVASSAPLMPRTPIKTNPAMTEDQISQQEAVMQQRRERLKKIAGDAPFQDALKLVKKEKMNTFNWRGRDYATQLPEMWTPRWTSPLNISIIPTNKVGGRINYFQQGGTASSAQQEQANAFMQAILQGDSEAIGQLIQAANQGDKQATQLIETILKEDEKGNQQVTKAAAVIKQLLSQTVQAKWGAKLGYLKSLKYAKGGKTCPACEQKVEMKKCGGKKAKKRYFGGLI